jgi:hypothetical protein
MIDIRLQHRRLSLLALILVCVVASLAPAVATAQVSQRSDPTAAQYDPVTPPKANSGSGATDNGATVAGLPFTGAEVGVLAIAAIVLLGGGIALRTYSRAEHN